MWLANSQQQLSNTNAEPRYSIESHASGNNARFSPVPRPLDTFFERSVFGLGHGNLKNDSQNFVCQHCSLQYQEHVFNKLFHHLYLICQITLILLF